MKVFIVPSWYTKDDSPNSGIFFKEQASALKENGLEVVVAYPEITSLRYIKKLIRTRLVVQNEEGILTYRYTGYHLFPKIRNATRLTYYSRLKKIYKSYVKTNGKPDIIHAHAVRWGGWAAAKIANKYNIPLVITEHSSAYGRNLIDENDKPLIKEAFNIAKKVIVVGPGLKREIIKYTDKEKIKTIPNIVNFSRFKPNKNVVRNRNNKFTFLSVAFLSKNKGMDFLIKAFAKSFKNNKSVELIIGGDGEEREKLEKLVRLEGVSKQVVFMGDLSRKQVVEQMQKCDVFVLASKYETFGVVYVEALACGKPIIATRCGGPESIVNKNNGLLVDIDNEEVLSKALTYMYHNTAKYNSNLIIEDCRLRFSSSSVSNQILKVFNECL